MPLIKFVRPPGDYIFPTARLGFSRPRGGALMQWLKLTAWKVRDRGFEPHSVLQVSKKQNVSSPLTHDDSILWETPMTER